MSSNTAMPLGELAVRLGCRLEGDPRLRVRSVEGLADAGPEDLSFVTDGRYAAAAAASRAGALLVGEDFTGWAGPRLVAARPELALAQAMALLRRWRPPPGVHATASIPASARIGAGSHIGAFVAIGEECEIGADAVLHPHVVVYPGSRIGARCTLHAHVVVREGTWIGDDVVLQPGVVLGGDGFGFARGPQGRLVKIPQVGGVRVEDGVEVQANSCIDRATLATTRIGAGTKIDNLAQVAHNCDLGENILLCAQVGLAGSTVIGEGAILAGQAGVAGHCTVGKGTIITAQSGTHGDLEAGKIYSGSPGFDHAQWLRSTAAFARLPELRAEVRRLREQMAKLLGSSSG